MKTRRIILGFAVGLDVILLSLALPVNRHSPATAGGSPVLVADGIPLPPVLPPPPPKKGT